MPNATLTSKGQTTIPKEIRDELQWEAGSELTLISSPSGVTLKAVAKKTGRNLADLIGMLKHDGPPISTEELCKPVHYGADLIALDRVEAYIHNDDLEKFVSRHALREVSEGRENVLLRVPPDWPFDPGARVAPPAVVAVDLVDAADQRSVRAGRDLLERIVRDRGTL